ncbi:MAG: GNAT family N-acetyltransferase [Lachnospiraceae bacterium]|nr:GNAT family N-acetyltransferase [Lachnospiraceae bacterium]
MNHLGTVELTTNRLCLRRFTLMDVEKSFRNWTSDEKVTKFLRWNTHQSVEETKRVIGNWCDRYDNQTFYQWAIVLKEEPLLGPIGTISVNRFDDTIQMAHLGFCIGSAWWNNGITSEALSEIIRFLFDEMHANRIESWHDPQNIYSGKVMSKCGMEYEGTLKSGDYSNRGIVDACVYAIIASEYRKTARG